MVGNNTTTVWTPPTWTAGTYQENAIVIYLAVIYISTTNNNVSIPSGPPTVTAWVTSPQVYQPKDIVSYLGNNYTCIYENNGITPIGNVNSSTYWILTAWNSSTDYAALRGAPYNSNWPVTYGGIYYFNLNTTTNINNRPDISPTYWTPINWEVYTGYRGYAYLSVGNQDPNAYTMLKQLQQTSLLYDFNYVNRAIPSITSIPPQPIKQYQTLNLRLGFTFNGIFSYNFDVVVSVYPQGSTIPLLLNRFRPVPTYGPFGVGLLGYDPTTNPYAQTTYTADAFCNLVYSSIINIYTNIIGPSTVDTERNVNLLDTVPMNCSNLGVVFYNPVISNKLTKIPNDIYSIYFEFRKEDGSEYYFSNNAVISLTLGLTYK
jgi:hypothetical protein